MDQACARCGTFAVLESNGFRELCAPCWVIARHRLDQRSTSFASLLESLGVLVREFWLPTIALLMLEAIPHAAATWFGDSPLASMAWGLVVGSFFEGLALSWVVQRTLAGRDRFGEALRHTRSRYLQMVAVNTLNTLLVLLGLLVLCIPGVLVSALVTIAVPLVLFEEFPAHRAIAESFRRVRPVFWEVAVVSLVLMTLSFLPFFAQGMAQGSAAARGQPFSAEVLAWLRVGTVLLGAFLKTPAILFQLVVWGATRRPGGGGSQNT